MDGIKTWKPVTGGIQSIIAGAINIISLLVAGVSFGWKYLFIN